jgi:hypothetical protein
MGKKSGAASPLRLVKWCAQWQEKDEWPNVPERARGVYALHMKEAGHYNVVYVGMSASGMGIKRRLRSHARSKRKGNKWSHFSFFVVWENVREEEIRELEILLKEIFRRDKRVNSLARQKGSRKMKAVRYKDSKKWPKSESIGRT